MIPSGWPLSLPSLCMHAALAGGYALQSMVLACGCAESMGSAGLVAWEW